MTSSHKPVKIIERKQRDIRLAGNLVPSGKTAQQIEREVVRTVKSWIDGRRKVMEKFAAADTARDLPRLEGNS